MRHIRRHLTFANVASAIALFVALGGGTAVALTGSDTVQSDDLGPGSQVMAPDVAANAVNGSDIVDNQVLSADVRNDTLAGGGLAAIDLRPNSVASSELANGAVTPAKFGTIPAARVTKSSAQSIPNATKTKLTFDTESYDTAALHDTSVNNTRLTAPISGVYQVDAGVSWTAGPTAGHRFAYVALNGSCTGAPADNTGCFGGESQSPAGANGTNQNFTDLLKLSAGDFVEVTVAHTAGSSIGVQTIESTHLAMHWVGPG